MNVPQSQRVASPPFSDAEGEIQRGMEVVEFATGAPQLLKVGSLRAPEPRSIVTRFGSRGASLPESPLQFPRNGDYADVRPRMRKHLYPETHQARDPTLWNVDVCFAPKHSGGAKLLGPCK
jgi:hypothetical protein